MKTVKKRGARGGGSICRRTDGRWCGRYTITLPTGQHKVKAIYGQTQAEVQKKLTQAKARRDRGEFADGKGMTVEKFFGIWISEIAPNYLNITTIEDYTRLYNKYILPNLGKKRLETLSIDDVQRCINAIAKHSLSQARVSHNALSSMLNHAQKRQYMVSNPAHGIELAKTKPKEKELWNTEELYTFLRQAQASSSYYLIYLLIATCGLRRGEALGIRYKDIDLEKNMIRIRQQIVLVNNSPQIGNLKTEESERELPISQHAREELEKLKFAPCSSDLVFTTKNNTPISPRNLYRDFEKLVKHTGLKKITLHTMRHMMVYYMLNNKIDLKTCQKILGHATLTTTLSIYAHTDEERKANAIDTIDKLIFQPTAA